MNENCQRRKSIISPIFVNGLFTILLFGIKSCAQTKTIYDTIKCFRMQIAISGTYHISASGIYIV